MIALVLAISLGAAHSPKAVVKPEVLLERARARMKALDFEGALPLLRRALESPHFEGVPRGRVLIDLGITLVNLGEDDEAGKAFAEALEADPEAQLPTNPSPKIADLYAKAKASRSSKPPPPPEPPPPEPPPVVVAPPPSPAVVEPVPPASVEPSPSAAVTAPASFAPHRFGWPITAAAVAVVGLGAGMVSAEISQSASATLRTGLHDQADTDALVSRQRLAANFAIGGYAVAGLAAVLAAILFGGEVGGRWFSATAAISPQGPTLGLNARF